MGGKVVGKRRLVVLSDDEDTVVVKAAKMESLPTATFMRRAAVRAARVTLTKKRGQQ
jgi:uncharacterized protein (DUF1778 family)